MDKWLPLENKKINNELKIGKGLKHFTKEEI